MQIESDHGGFIIVTSVQQVVRRSVLVKLGHFSFDYETISGLSILMLIEMTGKPKRSLKNRTTRCCWAAGAGVRGRLPPMMEKEAIEAGSSGKHRRCGKNRVA